MDRRLPAGVLAALGVLLVPVPAPAEDAKEDPGAGFRKLAESFPVLDANGDGKLSVAEFPSPELFAVLDANRDGSVTKEELEGAAKAAAAAAGGMKAPENADFAAWAKKRVGMDPRFNAEARRTEFLRNFDQEPKDGKIQKKEYVAGDADKVFRDFDRDKDGSLDERELLGLAKDQLADLDKARRHPTRANFLVLFDLDDDRKVTRDEYAFLRGPATVFVSLDADGDGTVTYEEIIYMPATKDKRYRGKAGAEAAPAPPPEKRDVWDLYDKDKDGRVTAEEFAGGEAVFRRLDRNRDGSLTAADL